MDDIRLCFVLLSIRLFVPCISVIIIVFNFFFFFQNDYVHIIRSTFYYIPHSVGVLHSIFFLIGALFGIYFIWVWPTLTRALRKCHTTNAPQLMRYNISILIIFKLKFILLTKIVRESNKNEQTMRNIINYFIYVIIIKRTSHRAFAVTAYLTGNTANYTLYLERISWRIGWSQGLNAINEIYLEKKKIYVQPSEIFSSLNFVDCIQTLNLNATICVLRIK